MTWKWPGPCLRARSRAQAAPPANLTQLILALTDQKRRVLLIGPDGSTVLADAWQELATAAIDLVRDLAPLAVAEGRKSRREAAQALASYREYLGSAR